MAGHSHNNRRERDESRQTVLPRYKEKHSLFGHLKSISSVKFSSNGDYLASAAADGVVKIWNVDNGGYVKSLIEHKEGLSDVAWSRDDNLLITASDDKTLKIWQFSSGYCIDTLEGHEDYVLSTSVGKMNDLIVSGSYDNTFCLWDLPTGKAKWKRKDAHDSFVNSVDFSRDDRVVLSGGFDGLFRIWDLSSQKCVQVNVEVRNWPVSHAKFSPNSNFVLAATLDNMIRIYDRREFSKVLKTFHGHKNESYSIFVNFCRGKYIVSGSEDHMIYIWDINDKQVVQKIKGHGDVVLATDCHPTKRIIASASLERDLKTVIWKSKT